MGQKAATMGRRPGVERRMVPAGLSLRPVRRWRMMAWAAACRCVTVSAARAASSRLRSSGEVFFAVVSAGPGGALVSGFLLMMAPRFFRSNILHGFRYAATAALASVLLAGGAFAQSTEHNIVVSARQALNAKQWDQLSVLVPSARGSVLGAYPEY